jgi:hypothetical protein
MIRIRSLVNLSLTIALAVGTANRLHSAEPVKITLHPAAEPTPALKYRLLPSRADQTPGNAAVDYGKVTAEEMSFFISSNRAIWDKIEDVWQEMPLEQLKRENVILPSSSIYFLEQGARRKYCDWQLPIGEKPFYGILLPDAQQSRKYARLLAVKARLEVAQGKFDEAVKTIQTGFALGRHVAQGETIVNGLIGIAINGIMLPQMLELMQQPRAPNLYWALTILPTPLVEMRDALDVEAMGLELSFPELSDIRTAKRSPDEWRELFRRFAVEIHAELSNRDSPPLPSSEQLDARCQQMLPDAKRSLIAVGMSAVEVEAMTMHQVALLYTIESFHEIVDDAIKYFSLPYPQENAGIEAVIERTKREHREIIPIGEKLFPVLTASRSAIARNDRQIAVLRVLEALRIHGASHDGKLPERLAEITEVPIPDDPVTGLPFDYRRDGDQAILSGPPLRDVPLHYEITMLPAQ